MYPPQFKPRDIGPGEPVWLLPSRERIPAGRLSEWAFGGCAAALGEPADHPVRNRRLMRVSIADIPRSRSGLINAPRPSSE